MSLWMTPPDLARLNEMRKNTICDVLDITFDAFDDNSITASMVVDHRTHQPFGLLHGGASVALAETLGSVAGNLCVDTTKEMVVGLEINANHVRAMRSGLVTGTARALHVGRSTQLWEIRIENDDGKLVCVSRLTLAVVPVAKG